MIQLVKIIISKLKIKCSNGITTVTVNLCIVCVCVCVCVCVYSVYSVYSVYNSVTCADDAKLNNDPITDGIGILEHSHILDTNNLTLANN